MIHEVIKLIECAICSGQHHILRKHCPYCGSHRVFLASHSYEAQHTSIAHRNAADIEVVRAYRSDLAFRFVSSLRSSS